MQLTTPEVDTDQLADAVRLGATIVDVREPHEYVAGHVPGAALIPMAALPHRMDEVDRGRPVYVICESGNRSATTTDRLRHAGYDAWSVAGGTSGWTSSGRPLVSGHAARH